MMAVMATVPHLRDPIIRRTGSGFEVWADEYVPNQPGAASTAKALRSLITGEVRALPAPGGRLLHAGYGGWRRHGTDVENLLFNNINQGLSLFREPAEAGVRFEDLGLTVPLAPDGTSWKTFYSYLLAPPGASFAAVRQGPLICRVSGAVVQDGPARLAAARIWLAVRRASPRPEAGMLAEHGSFLLRVTVHQLEPGRHVKAVVDGVTAAMQRDEPGRVTEAAVRLAKLLGADAGELLEHATAADAPLGARSRSHPASRESLFTLYGPAQVRVTPDDDRCIAAEVTTARNDGPARLTAAVYSATHRPT